MISVDFETGIYSVAAIKRAIYDKGSKNISITENSSCKLTIEIKPPPDTDNKNLLSEFKKLVHEHQIRIDTEKEFKTVRELIVAQALFPCENLEAVLKSLDL